MNRVSRLTAVLLVGLGVSCAGPEFNVGMPSLQIQFGEEPGEVRLVYVGGSGQPFVEPGYREEQSWVMISNQGAYPPPSPAP
jgi:hypothetical protein